MITAGPTWVAIDRVRVLSNIASGKTGILLAKRAKAAGAEVTLLLGPIGEVAPIKGVRILRFNYFDDLASLMDKELSGGGYRVVIHSAAVSDYRPKSVFKGKLGSGKKNLAIPVSPTPRIIDRIKRISPRALLVGFKLEFGLSKSKLIAEALRLSGRANADLVVANSFAKNRYSALIVDKYGEVLSRFSSKVKLAQGIIRIIKERL